MRPDDLLADARPDPPPLAGEGRVGAGAPAARSEARPEPVLGSTPVFVGFDDPAPLDPRRTTAEPSPPPRRTRMQPIGVLSSLGLHLLPLVLLLLGWASAPREVAPPIPVQLVLERPPPPPPKPPPEPRPEQKPPPGRLASESMGEPAPQPDRPDAAVAPATEPPAATQTAAAMPPPLPAPTPEPAATVPEIKPPPVKPPVKRAVARLAPHPSPAPGAARHPGPSATRDEYLAYCMTLVRRYFDMLPASFIAGRRGVTTLAVVVLDDGTIARISVAHGSGYSDIDSRVEQMLAAVRRFPPLPQWVQGPSVVLYYDMPFPEGLQGQ